ncbi:MAG: hypothetical protein RM347_001630 [Nostoc sp. ChiQUE02]|uniref:hypothetical protein n=1 Tax=Nostoc sp. ChiQUE02 TaxID=3075377 RepID=UPI002AD42B2F|nr:hypothetical protein [Nostoc sp. ChiQUE02]MDZ8235437.1 hypothetical protein [Nostoc sp. ChiQUE02]
MIQKQKFQSFNHTEKLVNNYSFQIGEIIAGKIVFFEILPLVSPGLPDKFVENNSEVRLEGRVHKVNNTGEVVSVTLLTEINLPSNDAMAYKKGDVISLDNMKSYSISLVE